jgi:hypothetical protein
LKGFRRRSGRNRTFRSGGEDCGGHRVFHSTRRCLHLPMSYVAADWQHQRCCMPHVLRMLLAYCSLHALQFKFSSNSIGFNRIQSGPGNLRVSQPPTHHAFPLSFPSESAPGLLHGCKGMQQRDGVKFHLVNASFCFGGGRRRAPAVAADES